MPLSRDEISDFHLRDEARLVGGLIERADEAMYEEKRSRRRLRKLTVVPAYEPETAGPQAA